MIRKDIIVHHTRGTPPIAPAFIQLVDTLTKQAQGYVDSEENTNSKEKKPLNQWVEQVLVVLQCLGLLVRNAKRTSIQLSASGTCTYFV